MEIKRCVIFLIIICLLITACSLKDDKPKFKEVNLGINYHSLYTTPLYIGFTQGFFKEEGLKVKLHIIKNESELINLLNEGKVDIAILNPITIINSKLPDIVCFSKLNQKEDFFLVSRKKIEDSSWVKINKKIIIGNKKDTTQQILLEYLLKKNNLKPYKNVDIIYNIPPDLVKGAFKGGVGDYLLLTEPEVSLLESEEKGYQFFSLGNELGFSSARLLTGTINYIKNQPEVIQKIVNAIYKAQIFCRFNNTREITKEIEPFFPDISEELMLKVVARYKYINTWAQNPLINLYDIEKIYDITNINDYKLKIDNSFAEKAVENISLPETNNKNK